MVKIPFSNLLFLIFITSCATSSDTTPFEFNHPITTIKLPEKLHEISGITLYRKNELACVQDENGVIYFYDIKKDKLRKTVPFARDNDYEGITDANDTLYVLCSNGVISEIDQNQQETISNTYNTFLSKSNNSEGLCFDEKNHRLLVACKGKPEKKTAPKKSKAIYSFDLGTKTMSEIPAFIIEPDSVKAHLIVQETNFISRLFKKDTVEVFNFEPSDLCIDPLTGDIFVLSSVGKTILSMKPDGSINFAFHLDPSIFKQPEGITFVKDGSMLISDEGRGGKANLIKIQRRTGG